MLSYKSMKKDKIINTKGFPHYKEGERIRNTWLISGYTLGLRLMLARSEKNLTQSELAKSIDTLYQRVHEWEHDWKRPSDKYLQKIAEVLDVSFDWLKYGDFTEEPRYNYERNAVDLNPLSEEDYEKRLQNLQKSSELLSFLSAESLEMITIILPVLYAVDANRMSDGQEYTFKPNQYQEKEAERLKKACQYIMKKLGQQDSSD